jgi:hypothetical protein
MNGLKEKTLLVILALLIQKIAENLYSREDERFLKKLQNSFC